jgi:hypothetical protein
MSATVASVFAAVTALSAMSVVVIGYDPGQGAAIIVNRAIYISHIQILFVVVGEIPYIGPT